MVAATSVANHTTLTMPETTNLFYRLGLTGSPLSHSLSPKIHAAALETCGLHGEYSLFPIPPDDKQGLISLLARVRAGEIHGLNVTIPHKQTVIGFLDKLTPAAQAIGAVNTIYLREGKLIGDNTDAPGFLSALNRFLSETQPQIENRKSKIVNRKSALVLGAGGSARAVVYALANDGWNVVIAARRIEQARQLADTFPNHQLRTASFDLRPSTFDLQPSTFNLIVNTTPLGMTPNIDQSPLPENLSLPSNVIIYDLVYNPSETKLVRSARAQGLQAATGLGMLIEQAALSFEVWTGHNPPREALWNAVAN
ncbi:MAG: shikimate dehydrogenase [Chloroflexi bacterium]|nr:shikimate dehydrogenase [Chloroflexota bacterium]MDL1942851.1 shikimate dehydrogenase [Chloroflexi bacterium CFX2]